MSTLFGGARARASDPSIPVPEAALRLTTSVQGKARPLGWGRSRIGCNVIWIGDFLPYIVVGYTPAQPTQTGGKGGGGRSQQQGTITYTWNYQIKMHGSLCEGPVLGIVAVNTGNAWTSWGAVPSIVTAAPGDIKNQFGAGNFQGPLLYATLYPGNNTQNPPGFMTTSHPTQALAYRGEAYLSFEPLLLGTSTSLPQMSFDVLFGHLCGLANYPFEAYPGDVIFDYFTNPEYGIPGYKADLVETPTIYNLFCGANSLLVSPVITDQIEASSFVKDMLQATHSAIFMSGGVLRIRPYAEADASDNGLTFTHDATPIYDLAPQDFLPGVNGTDPIGVNRKQPQELINNMRIEYFDRANSYSATIFETRDEASIAAYGIERQSDVRTQHFFTSAATASASAAMQLQREGVTTTYTFNLPREFELLDPMDLITLPLDKYGKGQARQPARIIEIVENDDYSFTITAEEYLGTADMPIYDRQETIMNLPDFNEPAGDINEPMIFELPQLLSGGLNIFTALSGQNPDVWGGAEVWASFDGENYMMIDRFLGSARMGVTTNTLPSRASDAIVDSAVLRVQPRTAAASDVTRPANSAVINAAPGIAASASLIRTGGAALGVSPAIAAAGATGSAVYNVSIGLGVSPGIATVGKLIIPGSAGLGIAPQIAAATSAIVRWDSANKAAGISLSGSNLTATFTSGGGGMVRGTLARGADLQDRYFEIVIGAMGSTNKFWIGLATAAESLSNQVGSTSESSGYYPNGFMQEIGGTPFDSGVPYGIGDTISVWMRAGGTAVTYYKNGTFVRSINRPYGDVYPAVSFVGNAGDALTANFGESRFNYFGSIPNVGTIASWDGSQFRSGVGGPMSFYDSIGLNVAQQIAGVGRLNILISNVGPGPYGFSVAPRMAAGSGTNNYDNSAALALTSGIATANFETMLGSSSIAVSSQIVTIASSPVYWNPSDRDPSISLSGSNLVATGTVEANRGVRANLSAPTGRYFEVIPGGGGGGNNPGAGFSTTSHTLTNYLGSDSTNGFGWFADGWMQGPGLAGYITGATYGNGDVLGFLYRTDGQLEVFKNGVSKQVATAPSGSLFPTATIGNSTRTMTINGGSSALSYLPSGATSWDGTQVG